MGRIKSHALAFLAGLTVVELAREIVPAFGDRRARRRRGGSDLRGLGDHVSPKNEEQASQAGRGREAEQPSEIPPKGWKDIALRTFKEFSDDQIPLISAGCTFYSLLALFPGIGAFVALYGLFADVSDAQRHVQAMSAVLPGGAISLIGDQLVRAAAARDDGLSLAFILGLLIALWSANGAMKAIITGLNIAYEEKEKRGLIGKILVPLAFTLGGLAFAALAMVLAAVGVAVKERMGASASLVYTAGYWAFLFIGLAVSLTLLYRFGPSRRRVRWKWISWGSGLAAVLWLAMSAGFSFYAANFGHYDESYGALGAAIGFMTWTWLSTMVLLLGAELNSEIEHQTAQDTTVGAPKPIGLRGAVMADTVGQAQ